MFSKMQLSQLEKQAVHAAEVADEKAIRELVSLLPLLRKSNTGFYTITADGKKYKVEIVSHEPPKVNIQDLNH